MESSSVVDDTGAPESWEFADLDDTMSRLRLNDSKPNLEQKTPNVLGNSNSVSASGSTGSVQSRKVSDETLNQVDQFLRDALQNPRERISILRMEQDIEKFVRDPKRQQFEFQQLPTSYLRLAAHRLAQHYSLQSVVLSDNGLADNCGSRIIVCKTSECRLPLVRLADIPVNLPSEDRSVVKVAIKKRPHIRSQVVIGSNSNSLKNNSSKSVEERKEEYNRARARIFSGSSSGTSVNTDGEQSLQDGIQRNALGNVSKVEDKIASWNSDASSSMGLMEPSISSNRSSRTWTKREPIGRSKTNNRVAIFRDREVDKTDPDYDRSYERYMQRFDPGFGLGEGHYTMQPMLTPAFDHNTEFPQLGSSHRPQISAESRSLSLPQHFPGRWSAPSTPAEMSYGHLEMLMQPFNTSHIGAHSTAAMYMHSAQYPCQQPGMPFMHLREPVQPSSQSHQQQPDASFGLARPR